MAKNKVGIDVEVNDNGTTKRMELNSKKAAKGMDDLSKNSRTADRNIKGVANTSSGASKNFSKMAQGTGGLVGAYATLAANVFAISAAFNFLKSAGDLAALQRGQEAYAVKTGQSLSLLSSRLQSATGDILDFQTASQAAAIGRAAGLNSTQLEGLAKVAKNASVALGRDLTDSFNRLTRGAIKAEPELLDELGIVLRLETATQKYADSIGKNVKNLTTFEKTQAVVNEVLEQGNAKFDDVGDNVNQIARLGKSFDDLLKSIKAAIEPFATFAAEVLADNVKALAAAFGILGLSITKAMAPAAPQMRNLEELSKGAKERLKGVAHPGEGKLAKNIRGGDIGKRELNAIERGLGAKSGSTVIDQSKANRIQVERDIFIMRARHEEMTAANATGFRRYTAKVKGYLAEMQAEHGKVMGAIKAGTAALASGLSKVLNAVAIIGMISLAITMVKELIEQMKDPALKKLEENAKRTADKFREQNDQIDNLVLGFERASTGAATLVKQANLLSNFSFDGINQTANALQKATGADVKTTVNRRGRKTGETIAIKGNQALLGAAAEEIVSLEKLNQIVKDQGLSSIVNVKEVEKGAAAITNVQQQTELLAAIRADEAILQKGAAGNQEAYNAALKRFQENLKKAGVEGTKMQASVTPQAQAIAAITNAGEGFDKFAAGLRNASTPYDTLLGFNNQFIQSLGTIKDKSAEIGGADGGMFDANQLSDIAKQLPDLTKEEIKKMTVQQTLNALKKREGELNKSAADMATRSLKNQAEQLRKGIGLNKVQKETLAAETNSIKAQDAIAKKKAEIDVLDDAKTDKDSIGYKAKLAELEVLKAQKEVAEKAKEIAEATAEIRGKLLLNEQKQFDAGINQKLLNIDQKRLDLSKERIALEERNAKRKMNRALRDANRGNAFAEMTDGDYRRAKAERDLFFGTEGTIGADGISTAEDSLMRKKAEQIREEERIKLALIDLEYTLLEAQMEATKLEIEKMAIEQRALGTVAGNKRADALDALATRVGEQAGKLDSMQKDAKKLVTDTAASRIADLVEEGKTLKEAVADATDLAKIKDKLAEGLATEMTNAFTAMVDGSKSAKEAFKDMAASMIKMITQMIMKMMILNALKASPLGGLFAKDGGITPDEAKTGGVFSGGRKLQAYGPGGIARGPKAGYPAILHGTEAVVPLPNNRHIPVELKGGGGTVNNVNVSVTVSSDGESDSVLTDEKQGKALGDAISGAVKRELMNQRRHGGMLSPYGVA